MTVKEWQDNIKYFKDTYGKCQLWTNKIDETIYFLEEIKHNDLMSENIKKCMGV